MCHTLYVLEGAGIVNIKRIRLMSTLDDTGPYVGSLRGCSALTSLQPLHACGLSRLTHLDLIDRFTLALSGCFGTLPALMSLDLSECPLLN